MPDYSTWDAFDLLEALELAGRLPDRDLIRACLERKEELTPGLLDMLTRGTLPHWEADDPRWFRDVHAGLLLIAFREEAALPVFDAILRDSEREDLVQEWFEPWLPSYGAAIVPTLLGVAQDPSAPPTGRTTAIRLLSVIGENQPGERPGIVVTLRSLLPPLSGTTVADRAPSGDERAVWSWAVSALADLRDVESRDHVRALFRAGWLDETVVGTEREYLSDLEAPLAEPDDAAPQPDLLAFYESLDHWDQLSDEALVDALHETLLDAGADAAAAEALKPEMLAALRELEEEDDADVAVTVLERLADRLRAHGVHEDRLEEIIEALALKDLDDGMDGAGTSGSWADHPDAAIRDRTDFEAMSVDELVQALTWSGRHPDPGLVRAVLARREDVAPQLLAILEHAVQSPDSDDALAEEDDPRWYAEVHAGLFLIATRNPAALPTFRTIFADDAHESLFEWFAEELDAYGPLAVATLIDILNDPSASIYGRTAAASSLANIARRHPEVRPGVLDALRSQLPALGPEGRPLIPDGDADDQTYLWTSVAFQLARLGDRESRPQITALFKDDRIDETYFGDLAAYERIVSGEEDAWDRPASEAFDLVAFYERLKERGEYDWDAEAEHDAPTFIRDVPKIGRNEKVTIRDPQSGATETLKYKHAQKKLDEGWELLA